MFGLPNEVCKLLCNYFSSRQDIEEVRVFGSRAMGTQSPGSDIDLAIFTKSDRDIAGAVQADLDELPTPYMFDVVDYRRIENPSLRSHIDRVGQVLYSLKKMGDV